MPTRTTDLTDFAHGYFESLADGNFGRVAWAPEAVLHTPLRTNGPLRGRRAIEDFFRPMAGGLGPIRMVETYVNSAGDTLVAEAFVGPLHVMDKFTVRDGLIVEQQNVFDPRPALNATPPGALSNDERMLLLDLLRASRTRFREACAGVSSAAWTRQPSGGEWSAAQCAEHLILTEEALLTLVRKNILTGPPSPGLVTELNGKDGLVVQAMQDRSAKSKTFDFLEPTGRWTACEAAIDAFLARRADTIEYVLSTADPVHYHAAPLGALGPLDAYHWLLLMAAHTDRHIAQLREAC